MTADRCFAVQPRPLTADNPPSPESGA